MNRPSDIDARLSAWLEEGPTSGPEEVLSRTFARARSTRQDHGRLHRLTTPSRFQPMYTTLKVAAVAALLLVAAIVIDPFKGHERYGAPGPSLSPGPSPIALLELPGDEPLDVGATYVIDYGTTFPDYPRIIFTVPADGWINYGSGNVGKHDHNPLITPWSPTNLMNDPCRQTTGGEFDPPVGPTIDDLVAGLVQQGAGTASTPTDATVGGYPAKRIELSMPVGLDITTCEGPSGPTFARWAEGTTVTGGSNWIDRQRNTLYIIDVDGFRLLMDSVYLWDTTEADLAEAEQLVTSMRFEPIAPVASPGASSAT